MVLHIVCSWVIDRIPILKNIFYVNQLYKFLALALTAEDILLSRY